MAHQSNILHKHSKTQMFVWCAMAVCPCLEMFGDVWTDLTCLIHVCLCLTKFGEFVMLSNPNFTHYSTVAIATQLLHC